MSSPRFDLLHSADWRAALAFSDTLGAALVDDDGFEHIGLTGLPQLAASELTTLSVCDLGSGQRRVIGAPMGAIDADARAAFDRHFRAHPLVRFHTVERGNTTHRISDSVPWSRFRETALFADYYRRIGIDHAIALPVFVDERWLVSFVLNRCGRDFDDRELARLDAVRPALWHGWQLRRALRWPPDASCRALGRLTPREREALHWVAAGKTDRDIAEILGCSPRTVHKHLQHCYAKLGVETRTAAAMRAFYRC